MKLKAMNDIYYFDELKPYSLYNKDEIEKVIIPKFHKGQVIDTDKEFKDWNNYPKTWLDENFDIVTENSPEEVLKFIEGKTNTDNIIINKEKTTIDESEEAFYIYIGENKFYELIKEEEHYDYSVDEINENFLLTVWNENTTYIIPNVVKDNFYYSLINNY